MPRRLGIGYVECRAQRMMALRPDRFRRFCRLAGVPAVDHNGCAVFGKPERKGVAYALAGAGDQRTFSGEVE
jgi:hypothetical protein